MEPIRRILRSTRRRLGAEDGIALMVALAATLVLAVAGSSLFLYSTSNSRAARLDSATTTAHALAEAGIAQSLSVLNQPGNDPLNAQLLSQRTAQFQEGTATWSGTLYVGTDNYWVVTSLGSVRNPDGTAPATATITVRVPLDYRVTQASNNQIWNYIFTTKPPTSQCDETIQQSVQVASPLYVSGNLCLQNSATISKGTLDVVGSLTLFQKANGVGSSSARINAAHIGGKCQWWNNPVQTCQVGSSDNVWASVLDSSPEAITPPQADWLGKYSISSPGPLNPCTSPSGPVPMFDNDTTFNNSIPAPVNLTPSLSYTCTTAGGELSWDAVNHVLTVSGTIFIDGSAYINNGAINTYTGQGALYLGGTFLLKNSLLCASVLPGGTTCDTTKWDPNTRLLGIIANGSGGQVVAGDSEQFVSSTFQGACYATHSIDIDTTSNVIGPLFGEVINLGQSVTTSFPPIKFLPSGFPGLPPVTVQPEPPIYLTG